MWRCEAEGGGIVHNRHSSSLSVAPFTRDSKIETTSDLTSPLLSAELGMLFRTKRPPDRFWITVLTRRDVSLKVFVCIQSSYPSQPFEPV